MRYGARQPAVAATDVASCEPTTEPSRCANISHPKAAPRRDDGKWLATSAKAIGVMSASTTPFSARHAANV